MKNLVNNAAPVTETEEFNCPICLCLVYQPKTCAQCENHLFCQDCLDKLLVKECPFCKGEDFKDNHKLLQSVLDKTEVRCSAKLECQGVKLTYEELIRDHARKCIVLEMECPMGCGTILSNKDDDAELTKSLAHYKECPKVLVDCDVCGYSHMKDEGANHLECVKKLKSVINVMQIEKDVKDLMVGKPINGHKSFIEYIQSEKNELVENMKIL